MRSDILLPLPRSSQKLVAQAALHAFEVRRRWWSCWWWAWPTRSAGSTSTSRCSPGCRSGSRSMGGGTYEFDWKVFCLKKNMRICPHYVTQTAELRVNLHFGRVDLTVWKILSLFTFVGPDVQSLLLPSYLYFTWMNFDWSSSWSSVAGEEGLSWKSRKKGTLTWGMTLRSMSGRQREKEMRRK